MEKAPASSVDLVKSSDVSTPAAISAVPFPQPAKAESPAAAPSSAGAVATGNPSAESAVALKNTAAAQNASSAAPISAANSVSSDTSSALQQPAASAVQTSGQKGTPKKVVSTRQKAVKKVASSRRKTSSRTARAAKPASAAATPSAKEQTPETQPSAAQPAVPEQTSVEQDAEEEVQSAEEAAAEAELEYAARMLEESKKQAEEAGRKIPPQASKNMSRTVPAKNKAFNPNAFRPGVEWKKSESTHFTIYTQKRDRGISSSNMAMTFESSYDTLRRFIPWMMSGKVRVFVYQDYQSYLKHEPQAKAWTRALAYPTRGEIVVYDDPDKPRELKETFTHELTHIFTQQFFDKHHTNRIMTPSWLDEGLAVFMEDQAYSGRRGGPWSNDLRTLDFRPEPQQERRASFGFGRTDGRIKPFARGKKKAKPVHFMPFEDFMEEGSLEAMESKGRTQDWYLQAFAMVRFLLNPSGGASPSNRMQFQQFTTLMAQGEPVRNASGFLVKDKRGQTVYQPYSAQKALGRAYRYSNVSNFEDAFWRWAEGVKRH